MNKKELSERDICTKFITPALRQAGWDELTQLREEVSFTKGRIIVRGKMVSRGKAKRADYNKLVTAFKAQAFQRDVAAAAFLRPAIAGVALAGPRAGAWGLCCGGSGVGGGAGRPRLVCRAGAGTPASGAGLGGLVPGSALRTGRTAR